MNSALLVAADVETVDKLLEGARRRLGSPTDRSNLIGRFHFADLPHERIRVDQASRQELVAKAQEIQYRHAQAALRADLHADCCIGAGEGPNRLDDERNAVVRGVGRHPCSDVLDPGQAFGG